MTTGTLAARTAPRPGFADPVHDAQRVFRTVMTALSRPGLIRSLDSAGLQPPAPLTPTAAALALTLLDYDTPLWLDGPLARSRDVCAWLKFHTGAPVVAQPLEAAFALVSDPEHMPGLGNFPAGTAEYPDRSATLILQVRQIADRPGVILSGPGIASEQPFSAAPLSPLFWDQARENRRLFPRGADILFAADGRIAGLPRSTTICKQEA
ncbi:phosphonate C-P lyase system protein PhnH [Polymorphum gilvum]|uniref:Phosphonate C-P lyase system protein PhnH n=1 Tax=Polymorphum gilvum (strain LMG 25793 / CGMCC 1.9160 / SL003B-26A1) TaxID=991905 RepID=F2J2Z2_POLGS|nr:phosphonate C-P lyase system protein PhnH [Polymorphum gilvum]ADZ68862.1 Phosphonate C-P lyase system protein PhnH [Polymorphum gilvum SL003B-26A1]